MLKREKSTKSSEAARKNLRDEAASCSNTDSGVKRWNLPLTEAAAKVQRRVNKDRPMTKNAGRFPQQEDRATR